MLPYDYTCPVIYDNDDHRDVYTDEYLLALASAGEIELRGMITSYPYDIKEYEEFLIGRREIVSCARRTGFRNAPDPVDGPFQALKRPPNAILDNTQPDQSDGVSLILAEARRATPDRPLVVITGGPLTAPASAYLMDPTIVDRMVVAALCGSLTGLHGWNCGLDLWAARIVLERLTFVIFPESAALETAACVPKARLYELPESELRAWMIRKEHPHNELPAERDCDGQPAIALMRPEYCLEIVHVHATGETDNTGVPLFKQTSDGNALLVTLVDQGVATDEFFRALRNPRAYEN